MSDIDPTADKHSGSGSFIDFMDGTIPKSNITEEEKKEEKLEEKKDNEEDIKEEKEVKENEEEKSDEEKEKSESSKESHSESEGSKSGKESEEKKDKKEKDSEENEEDDDDDDDIGIDDDSEESSSEKKQKDPYHGYLSSKTENNNFFYNDVYENDYVYGIKQNKFFKIGKYKSLTNDKKVKLNKFELKELKKAYANPNQNTKLIKNTQYMASIYGKAIEKDKKEKSKDININNEDLNNGNNNPITKKEEKKEEAKDTKEENKEITEQIKEDSKEKEEKEEEQIQKETKDKTKDKEKDKEKNKEKDKKGEKDSKKKKTKKEKNSNLSVVIKDSSEYLFFQKIRLIYLNSLNTPSVFNYKININISIQELINQFKSLYHYKLERYSEKLPLIIFINGKKHSISNTNRSKYFIPTKFDYKNDYVLIVEKNVSKFRELSVNSSTNNKINLKGADVPHLVYNSLYNLEVDSFIIPEGLNCVECTIYELKNYVEIRQFTDNEYTIRRKLKEFLQLNWKERTNFVTSFVTMKVKKGKGYGTNLAELNRKFILLQGKMYIFLIKSTNKNLYLFTPGRRYSNKDGIFIVTINNKSLLDGFKAKLLSDFYAFS